MSRDIKDRYQEKAEELADTEYGMDFYDLPEGLRLEVYGRAVELVHDDLASEADSLRKDFPLRKIFGRR